MARVRSEYAQKRLADARAQRDRDAWRVQHFRLLPLAELARLRQPSRGARRPGVYFLFNGSVRFPQLQYIGSAVDVWARLCGHTQPHRFATYLPIEWGWHLAIEALYIREYSPPLNRDFLDRRIHPDDIDRAYSRKRSVIQVSGKFNDLKCFQLT